MAFLLLYGNVEGGDASDSDCRSPRVFAWVEPWAKGIDWTAVARRIDMKKLIFSLLLTLSVVCACGSPSAEQLRDGDLIFQTSRSNQSIAIQRATHSQFSHVGIIFFRNGSPSVYEAAATVRYTPLSEWTARGEGGHYVVKRLRDAERLLTPRAVTQLKRAARKFQGKPYDPVFEWSDDRIYCSELVWKIYDRGLGIRIGSLKKLRNFDLSDPLVKRKMKERYGSRIPLDEPVISPGEMFDFAGLTIVAEH